MLVSVDLLRIRHLREKLKRVGFQALRIPEDTFIGSQCGELGFQASSGCIKG